MMTNTGDGQPAATDDQKRRFISAVIAAGTSAGLATDTSGYGEGGWIDGSNPFDAGDYLELAISAWFHFIGAPTPVGDAFNAECEWWNSQPAVDAQLRDDIDTLRDTLRTRGLDPSSVMRRGRLGGASIGEVAALAALTVHREHGGHIVTRDGSYYNVVDGGHVVDMYGTATARSGPDRTVTVSELLSSERLAGLWRYLNSSEAITDQHTDQHTAEYTPSAPVRPVRGRIWSH